MKIGAPNTRCLALRTLVTSSCRRTNEHTTDGTSQHEQQHGEQSTQDHTSHSQEEADHEYAIKQRILRSSLPHVLECGWTKDALEAGARSEGLPPVAQGMFPRGGADLAHFFYAKCNADLGRLLALEVEKAKAEGLENPPTKPFMRDAVETRLRMIVPYLDTWTQAMAIFAMPQNAPEALTNLFNLADEIWYHAGDKSIDFNWYTKRIALAGVYKTTEIYMIQDKSPDLQDTWVFLDNRLSDLQKFGAAKKSCEESGTVLKEALTGFSIMGRNILGMNTRNR